MIITYNPGLKEPSVYSNELIEGVLLKPGKNDISESDCKKLRSHPIYGSYMSLGVIAEESADIKEIEPEPMKKKLPIPEKLNDGKDPDPLSP